MKMKSSHLLITVLLLSCLAATYQDPWLLLLTLSFLLLTFNTWLVPGGHAWRKVAGTTPTAPGPTGWPLLGCIPVMGSLAHRKLAELAMSHRAGRLMALSLGMTPVVIASHPDTAREILCGVAFSDRPVKASARLLMFERAVGFAPSGEYWRHLRRLAASNLFSPRRVAALEGLRQRVADDMVERVWREMDGVGMVAMRGVLQKGSLQNVVGSVFGNSLGVVQKEELVEMVNEGYDLISRFNWEDHFPFVGFLDFFGIGKRCKHLTERVRTLVGRLVQDKRRQGDLNQDDFLTVLLSLPEEDRLSDSDIIAVLWEMVFRGVDAVAILLEWIMARMVLHPSIQFKVQQELDTIVGHHRPVQDSDMPNLHYLQAVVKEVLRMHPPGPLLSWARLAVDDVHVGKFFVPTGTTAMVNMWAITHDGSIWKEPWSFRPERFLEEDVSVMGSDLRLAPFGAGRRVCPGRALGLTTVHLWLARLLQQYTWVPGRPVRLSECLRFSMEMKKPLVCRVDRRSPCMKG